MLSKNQVGEIRALHQKKQRDLKRQFIAEGVKTTLELLTHYPKLITQLYGTPEFAEQHHAVIKADKIHFTTINTSELERISLLEKPNQVLAVCKYLKEPDLKFNFDSNFSLYLDEIRDPGNFGTLLRLADWYGISKLFCSEGTCEFYNPKVIQASMGAFLRVEVVYTSLTQLISENNIKTVYGALLNGANLYREILQPGLIVIGNEANGITKENLSMVNKPITIPAAPGNKTESLNAAMAAGIICSEFFRQLQ
ncbi:MAG: RNA methyltransferase [Bacteroidia bacterium]|jgi:TrmH family RNA methyltransferase|nr:RNA methyltransferase [Bacteroidia bacterium]